MADLSVTVHGTRFRNPVLPAAGPNVRTGRMMQSAAEGGAGGIVSKTVSTRPADDKRPTIRRTTNGGLMNSETWSEIPVEEYLADLAEAKESGLPLIVSVGYQPEEVRELGRLIEREIAPDAFEFSTHYTGKETAPLVEVARALREAVHVPVWMKVSPNFPDIPALARAVAPYVDGFVAINSYGPVLDFDPEKPVRRLGSPDGTGWLSGPPIRPIALRIVYELTHSQEKPVMGVGGIASGRDAVQFIMAGATLVQVCTAAIRRGHKVYGKIAAEIDTWLDEHGYDSVDAIRDLYDVAAPATPATPGDAKGAAGATAIEAGGPGAPGGGRGRSSHVMTIVRENCTGCKACMGSCIHGALSMDGEVAAVDAERCIGCGYCQDSCRYDAMKLEVRPA